MQHEFKTESQEANKAEKLEKATASRELACRYPSHILNGSHMCVTYALQTSKVSSGFISWETFIIKKKTWKSNQSEKLPTEKQVYTVTREPTTWLVLRVSRWPSEPGFHSLGSTVCHSELVSAFLPIAQWVPRLPCLFLMASTAFQVLCLCVF